VVTLILALGGCFSAPAPVEASTINIANPYVGVAELTPDNYIILGRISATSSVTYNSNTASYTGDTLKYGSFGDIGSIGHIQNVQTKGMFGVTTGTTSVVTTPSSSRDMAISNATYDLIEKAYAMNADALIFVTTMVEASGDAKARTTTSKATISGIAIKMK